jgi:hypothetical protein
MDDMAKITVEGMIVSSERVAAYGGVRLSEEAVHSVAEQLKNGSIRFGLHHDPRLALEHEVLDVFETRGDDGILRAFARIEVDEDEWNRVGGPDLGGWSVSASEPAYGDQDSASLVIAADAHWFDDAALKATYDGLQDRSDSVSVSRLYQFSAVPETVVLIELVLSQVPPFVLGIAVNWVYDGLKHLVIGGKRARPSRFHFKIKDASTGRTVEAHLETGSDRVLKRALKTLPAAVERASRVDYDEAADEWKSPEVD